MANAFYSLYSHVSRTPLQKLATPEFTFSSSPVEKIERFRNCIRSEPRSPVERLKDTVSKMCLYTGSPRGSDSTSPQPSPRKRSSLPDVVGIVLHTVKTGPTKKLDLGEYNRSNSAVDVRLVDDNSCNGGQDKQTQQNVADTDNLQSGNKVCHEEMQDSYPTDNADADKKIVKPTDSFDRMTQSVRTSLASSLSGETVIEIDHQLLSCQPELDSCLTQNDTRTANLKPVAKVTFDLICPQIVESVHQVPFCCQHMHSVKANTLPHISSGTGSIDRSCPASQRPHIQNKTQAAVSEPNKDSHTVSGDAASSGEATQVDVSRSLPVLDPNGSYTLYCITVTGWEGDKVSSCSLNTPDSSHTSNVPPVQTCEESFSQYLNPLTHQALRHNSDNLQQVNSFELEEVIISG